MKIVKLPFPDRRAALAACLAACGAVLLAGCGRGAAGESRDAEAVPEVVTVQATAAGEFAELRLPARAVASESARLYPRATGFVTERRVDLGDRVEAGQVLAVVAAPEVDQEVRAAEAEARQARVDLELASGHHTRAEAMVRDRLISQEDYSDRRGARDAAQAALASAEARLANARQRQAFQQVRAPFAGVIAARNVERGDRVVGDSATAAAPLFELNALDPLRVQVDVPQSAALQVRPGLAADVTFPELPGERFRAEVVRASQSISGEAGGMRVELRLPNPDGRIPAGMVGEVRLQVPRAAAALVPLAAVVQDADGARVAGVGEDSTVAFRRVVLGRNLGEAIEVVEGVAPGDTLVLAPNALLADGSRVRARPAEAPPRS